MAAPVLSICVPSRNRQKYFKETIDFLLASPRHDFELVVADNSDDPAIMDAFMASRLSDPRLCYLPSESHVLSMQDNWERTVNSAHGDWISVIGDDDLIDPDLIDALAMARILKPDLEAFAWASLRYSWGDPDSPPEAVRVPLLTTFHDMPPSMVARRAFRWDEAGVSIISGFSIYHSAIARPLIDRIRQQFGGRVFGHPVVDYDSALKVAALGRAFVYCQRPLSIFGACPESNSSALYDLEKLKAMNALFFAESGRNTDHDPWLADFPFPSTFGLPAAVGQVQQWLQHVHGIAMMEGWEVNFARACARCCGNFRSEEAFALASENFRAAFSIWRDGAFLAAFDPKFRPAYEGELQTGLIDKALYVSDRIGGARSPAEFYRIVSAVLEQPGKLTGELRSAGREFMLLATIEPPRKIA